jgi:flagellar hook-basal body complex protein FliE
MNEISPEQLLSQIRMMRTELGNGPGTIAQPSDDRPFGDLLKTTLSAVNESQQKAGEMKVAFENGTGSASLAEVMIASQKADLSFRAMTEVRNKLVTAYQEIMNMPV